MSQTVEEWQKRSERDLRKILKAAVAVPAIRKLGPSSAWTASVRLIRSPAMKRLNCRYRGKNRPTDVLSFPAPEIFRRQGQLGELVICLPVLKRQARELEHTPETELKILLVHGLLHLLGLDHERGPRQAAEMARLERKLLGKAAEGLIQRAG